LFNRILPPVGGSIARPMTWRAPETILFQRQHTRGFAAKYPELHALQEHYQTGVGQRGPIRGQGFCLMPFGDALACYRGPSLRSLWPSGERTTKDLVMTEQREQRGS
jgi:hypothetical protein